ncbi:MAG: antitoxin [Adlercreutzia sp.]|uniref:antitoxin n=1 Tax=uncultured Adlercreutzia sp. TaxID=875803 RepID=UPI0021712204|nr:antitoxin [uncultured Adlercreutzia sp.]MCI8424695.1 antitoxin [Adlercreutzia sp.]
MPQLSLYLDEPTMELLRSRSSRSHQSMSKYVTGLIRQSDRADSWPEGYWERVYGCLKDPSFVVPEEVDVPLDDVVLFE